MKWSGLRTLGVPLAVALLLAGCAQLPSLKNRSQSVAVENTADTSLGALLEPLVLAHPGKSGVIALANGPRALATRIFLANAAQRSLDVQYYIWHNDIAGTLMFSALNRAAQRGVRVRLLLDDNNRDLDGILRALDAQPNIEVRLFNPFMHREWRILDYLTDFSRLNRRMHNKSFTSDNQITIVGGRNIGDEYFGAGQDFLFVDLDVIAVGPVVRVVSKDFDRYWASGSSYPVDRILPKVDPASISGLSSAAVAAEQDPVGHAYEQTLATLPFQRQLREGRLPFVWATTHMISDDPAKGLGLATANELLSKRLERIFGSPAHELQIVSPYFVPTSAGVRYLAALARKGVKITILTNSLEATDVAIVHAGYAKRRKPLLRAGIALFEMKRLEPGTTSRKRNLTGSSGSSLHAKTISIDHSRLFIGSFNFDPRSARLNTEMGFVIDSPQMARAIPQAIGGNVLNRAYEVVLNPAGELRWLEHKDGKVIVYDTDPGTGFWLRFGVSVLSELPIDWLL